MNDVIELLKQMGATNVEVDEYEMRFDFKGRTCEIYADATIDGAVNATDFATESKKLWNLTHGVNQEQE